MPSIADAYNIFLYVSDSDDVQFNCHFQMHIKSLNVLLFHCEFLPLYACNKLQSCV